jgi:hypothetical protein
MAKQTRLDRILDWIKNNKVTSGAMLAAIGIVATSQLVSSLTSLVQSGKTILSSRKDNEADHARPNNDAASEATQPTENAESEEAQHFGKVALQFGHAGIGPGFFTDARFIAVDRQGRVYVGEYQNRGRVQRFDSNGQFLSQWFAVPQTGDKDFIVRAMAIDEHGVLYMAQPGGFFRYEAETGTPLGKVAEPAVPLWSAESVQPNPTGGMVIWWEGEEDDNYLVLINAQGEIRRTIKNPLASHLVRSDHIFWPHVAVDGLGNVYVAADGTPAVFKFSPDGEFFNRFGSEGRGPGQFYFGINGLAVNGKGDVYVADAVRIQRFDGNGTYLSSINLKPNVMGLAFNDAGDLYAAASDHVVKIRIEQ